MIVKLAHPSADCFFSDHYSLHGLVQAALKGQAFVIDSKWVLRLDAHVGGQVAVVFEAPFQCFDSGQQGYLVNRVYPPHRSWCKCSH